MANTLENPKSTSKILDAADSSGEAFRQGEWLCHRAPADIVAHGADGTTVKLAKKGDTVCGEYSPQILDLPPIFKSDKTPVSSEVPTQQKNSDIFSKASETLLHNSLTKTNHVIKGIGSQPPDKQTDHNLHKVEKTAPGQTGDTVTSTQKALSSAAIEQLAKELSKSKTPN